MQQADRDELVRHARRWADVAWEEGWHSHAIDVLDKAIELQPNDFKLYRKRGAFYLLCPDVTLQDAEQGILDLRRACELARWREDLVRWAAALLKECGEVGTAKDLLRELVKRGRKSE